uniref:Uncharacterized protein n=2 Tax=Rhinopithecus TaxID=542827 RepID=A0A2K6JQ54_RHIBE
MNDLICFLDNTFKNNVLSQAWWCVHLVPTVWEAEAGGSPELQCPMVAPVNYCTPAWAT